MNLLFGILCLMTSVSASEEVISSSTNQPIPILQKSGLSQNVGQQINLNLSFTNEEGHLVRLRDFFGQGPTILALVYYKCPSLCNLVMNGLFRSLQQISLERGKEFNVVFVSFDPTETPELAFQKKKKYLTTFLHSESEGGIHFLTGKSEAITELSDQVGFRYNYDKFTKQYAHPGVIMILTPEGKISRYFFGIEYPSKDVRLSLVEASSNQIGSPIDHFLLFCYRYDPLSGKYGLVIMNVLKALSLLTLVVIAGALFVLSSRNRTSTPGVSRT